MGDDLLRLQAVVDIVLLLVEQGEACCNITGHQVCVLGGKAQWPAVKPIRLSRNLLAFSYIEFTGRYANTQVHYIEKGIYYFLCVWDSLVELRMASSLLSS